MENKDTLTGVKCVVNSCTYNKEGNYCTANAIEILPRDAKSSSDTDCGTFKSSMK